jgi:bifunctional non-homologous end joining protein LigD
VLRIHDKDLRQLPLIERKERLLSIMPRVEGRVRYVDYIHERGTDFFNLACAHDVEGIVAKWAGGSYQHGSGTSWLKVKNPTYSQMEGRSDLFDASSARRTVVPPVLSLV